jgi:S1-C subfamily serine protease
MLNVRYTAAFAAMALLLCGLVPHGSGATQAQEFESLKKLQAERRALARRLSPSVVAVSDQRPDMSNPQATGMAQGAASANSGFVVDEEYVVTTFETADFMSWVLPRSTGEAKEPIMDGAIGKSVWMMAHDGSEFSGKVVGGDVRNLMLLIKMDDGHPKLPSLKLANSDKVEIGATGVGLGNTLDSLVIDRQISFSYGTVCGFYRFEPIGALNEEEGGDPYRGNVLEYDSACHPGDYGGPICNLDGEVIGMMTPHFMAGRHLGTAVPSNQIAAVLPQLKKGVKQGDLAEATLGFKAKYSKDAKAIVFTDVTPQGPAEKAGIKAGMKLLRVDNYKIPSFGRLKEMLGIGILEREVTVGGGGISRPRKTKVFVSYGLPIGTHIQLTLSAADGSGEKTVDLISVQKEDDF